MSALLYDDLDSPVGRILLVGDADALVSLDFAGYEERMSRLNGGVDTRRQPGFGGFREAVEAYFSGDLRALDAVAVRPRGTAFQQRVWRALREIPPGKTATYGEIAERLGSPGAARAIGLANSRNPVALVVPCHRVVGANRSLTGYAGGLQRKRWLLEFEQRSLRTAAKTAVPRAPEPRT